MPVGTYLRQIGAKVLPCWQAKVAYSDAFHRIRINPKYLGSFNPLQTRLLCLPCRFLLCNGTGLATYTMCEPLRRAPVAPLGGDRPLQFGRGRKPHRNTPAHLGKRRGAHRR